MIRLSLSVFFLSAIHFTGFGQTYSGQWKGEFQDKSTQYMGWGGDKCEYILELECKADKVSGFSYTYFTDGAKRYYTICRLTGTLDKKKKYIEVRETERTKTNVPAEINNCFQVHKLTYFKKTTGDETLEGNWIPAPNQPGNCGFGLTSLSRRSLKSSFPGFKPSVVKSNPRSFTAAPAAKKNNELKSNQPVVKSKTLPASASAGEKQTPLKNETSKGPSLLTVPKTVITPGVIFEKRNTNLLKTIEVESATVKIDLYDNGEVDGDSVSLFLNGKLIMRGKKLTAQPLTILLPKEELQDENELVMYAENLGTIPPNTALMVVTDGSKRYEVRITSDLEKSGTIKFVKKK
jgi:hypothetical protein